MINPYQTGFIPRRLISDNGWITQAIMQHYNKIDNTESIPAVAACFDQEKAYDRVHPEYLARVLLHFGFPVTLVKSLHTLFFSTRISRSINGWLGEPYWQRRGLRYCSTWLLNPFCDQYWQHQQSKGSNSTITRQYHGTYGRKCTRNQQLHNKSNRQSKLSSLLATCK